MPKLSEQYPSVFSRIGRRTVDEGEWELTLKTKAKANYAKIQWYAYARALQHEKKLDEWVIAARVMVRTRENVIIFSDRDKGGIGGALAESFAKYKPSYAEDPAGKAFEEMLAAKRKKEEGSS